MRAALRPLFTSGLAAAMLLAACVAPARAAQKARHGGHVIVFFARAASGDSITGHSYLRLGRVTASGKTRLGPYFGFNTASETFGYPAGFFGTEGKVGESRLDKHQPPAAVFRAVIGPRAYRKVLAFLRRGKRRPPRFGLFDYNCNDFLADAARRAGLKTPASSLWFPVDYVRRLKQLNTHAPVITPAHGASRASGNWRAAKR